MLDRFLPRRLDNAYRGHRLALWLFAVVVFVQAGQGLMSMFNGYYAASSPDAIPLDTYGPAAAGTVVTLFALLGLLRLIICLVCVLALVRYRTMIPLMFALLALEYSSRRLTLYLLPIVRTGTPPGTIVNLALLALMVVGLILSLRIRRH
jgi:MYXO-CTERM domain-containing protein